jgi:hypothetical protein
VFDDPNLIADAGLVPVVVLAEWIGLPGLVAGRLAVVDAVNSVGAGPVAKVMSQVAGMVVGAASVEDADRSRQTGNDLLFDQARASSALGTFLWVFTHGCLQQFDRVLREGLVVLVQTVNLLPGAQ